MSVAYHGERYAGYRLVELIGCTSVSTVHRAVDPDGRTVAVKILDGRRDAAARERVLREAAIARDLHHPHIVPVHETGEAEGRLFIAMDLVAGGDLGGRLAAGERLDPEGAVALLAGVAAALDAAHTAGLVHGDVKPSNILVDPVDGIARLSDFGSGTGTPEDMAPEQLDGAVADARTDLYGLAVVLRRCLDPRRRLTDGLEEVLARGAARRRDDRYPTAATFLAAVRSAIAEPRYRDPAAAALNIRPAAPRRPLPLSPMLVAAVTATALAGTAGLVVDLHGRSAGGSAATASTTARPPAISGGLLAPGTVPASPTPSSAPSASTAPVATSATTPAPAVVPTTPATPPAPAAPTASPILSISPPLSGGNVFYATVRNTGQTDLVAGAGTLTNTAVGSIVHDGCAGVHLAPGGSCIVTVRLQQVGQGPSTTVLSVPLSDGRPVTFTMQAISG